MKIPNHVGFSTVRVVLQMPPHAEPQRLLQLILWLINLVASNVNNRFMNYHKLYLICILIYILSRSDVSSDITRAVIG